MRSNYENPEVTEKLVAARFLSPADPARTQLDRAKPEQGAGRRRLRPGHPWDCRVRGLVMP
ncbi:MAG: hypothetical protein F4X74_01265 [Acidimicrobiia bacterium]|nr:hypothetical protein [Acidimicrobiia bacterium]